MPNELPQGTTNLRRWRADSSPGCLSDSRGTLSQPLKWSALRSLWQQNFKSLVPFITRRSRQILHSTSMTATDWCLYSFPAFSLSENRPGGGKMQATIPLFIYSADQIADVSFGPLTLQAASELIDQSWPVAEPPFSSQQPGHIADRPSPSGSSHPMVILPTMFRRSHTASC